MLQAPKESGFKEEVKVGNDPSGILDSVVSSLIQVLSKFRHANLVILMGFARNGHERCLVYELLSGGESLISQFCHYQYWAGLLIRTRVYRVSCMTSFCSEHIRLDHP